MKGKVVSYISAKKYGFITGDDGESYFLHYSSLLNKTNEDKLVKGVIVEFDPTPTPKGMSAKKVKIPEVYFKKELAEFFITRQSQPKYGTVEKSHSLSTRFFADPNKGREHIKQLAINSGCNAILNLSFEKSTFSTGNYSYTVHSFKGDFSLVAERIPCENKKIELDSYNELQDKVSKFDDKFKEVKEMEDEARNKQFEKSDVDSGALTVFFIFFFFIFILVIVNIVGG